MSEREVEFCDFFFNHGSLKWCNFKIFLSYFMHEAWKDAVFPFHVLSWEFYKFQIMLGLREYTPGIIHHPLGMLFFFNLGHNLFLQRPWAYSISLVERSEHLPSAFISILHVILRFKQIKWFGMATSLCPAWGKNPRLSTHTSEHFTTPKAYGWAVGQFLDTKLTLFMLLPVL